MNELFRYHLFLLVFLYFFAQEDWYLEVIGIGVVSIISFNPIYMTFKIPSFFIRF